MSQKREPYRPSCGTEGLDFAEVYCTRCAKAEPPHQLCPIADAAFWNLIGDPDYPAEWVYGDDGKPTCTAFEAKGEIAGDRG